MKKVLADFAKQYKGITFADALILCQQYNYPITKPGLRFIGSKQGFMYKIEKHILVDELELIRYIDQIHKSIPDGWILISRFIKRRKNRMTLYRIIRLNEDKLEIRLYGRERKRYAKEKELRRIIAEYYRNNFRKKT